MNAVLEPPIQWSDRLPLTEWADYANAIATVRARGVPFAVGGGFAFSAYAHRWRWTKDLDLYVMPEHRDAAVTALRESGFDDLFEQKPYDRRWIHRTFREDKIVDVIWSMANFRAVVDEGWLTRGREAEIHGTVVRLLPVEELIWAKLYIVQRDRADWPDILNLIYAQGPTMDWARLLDRAGDDAPVIGAVLSLFRWMCPGRAAELPKWVWQRAGVVNSDPRKGPEVRPDRVGLLDLRDWFGPND